MPRRAPHIHVKIRQGESELLTTQSYVAGDPGNERDGILRSFKDEAVRKTIVVDFTPKGDKGELAAQFDVENAEGVTPTVM